MLAQTLGEPSARQFVLLPTGPGQPKPLSTEPMSYDLSAFFPEGKRILLVGSRPGHGRQAFVQSIDGGGQKPLTPEGTAPSAYDYIPAISPDGRFIVVRDKVGSVFLWPVDGGPSRPIPWLAPGQEQVVNFASDGQWLHILRGNAVSARVSRLNISTGERQPLLDLTPRDAAGANGIDNFQMTHDGRAYVYSVVRRLCDLYLVEGLQ